MILEIEQLSSGNICGSTCMHGPLPPWPLQLPQSQWHWRVLTWYIVFFLQLATCLTFSMSAKHLGTTIHCYSSDTCTCFVSRVIKTVEMVITCVCTCILMFSTKELRKIPILQVLEKTWRIQSLHFISKLHSEFSDCNNTGAHILLQNLSYWCSRLLIHTNISNSLSAEA